MDDKPSTMHGHSDHDGGWTIMVPVAALFCLALASTHGLLLDESATAWVTSGSWNQAAARAERFQLISPLYFTIVWLFRKLLGSSEIVLRLPSICFAALAMLIVGKIARKTCPNALPYLLVLLLGLDPFLKASIRARVYALLIFLAAASIFFLWGIIEKSRKEYALPLAATSILGITAHPLFVIIPISEGLWCLSLFMMRLKIKGISAALLAVVLPVICVIPELFLSETFENRYIYALGEIPDISELFSALIGPEIPVFAALYILSVRGKCLKQDQAAATPLFLSLICCLYVLPVLILWLTSRFLETPLFLPRYYSSNAPALGLVFGMALERLSRIGKTTIACIFIAVIISAQAFFSFGFVEKWKETSKLLRSEDPRGICQAVLFSGLVESQELERYSEEENFEYLSAPFQYYRIPQSITLLPVTGGTDTTLRYIKDQAEEIHATHECVFVISLENFSNQDSGALIIKDEFLRYFKLNPIEWQLGQIRILLFRA